MSTCTTNFPQASATGESNLPPDPREAARAARLRYVSDAQPGIRRERDEDGDFYYIGVHGEKIDDEPTLNRIKSLGIPPAYTDVWICPIPNGHLQATGRDARGRKQYRYHSRWRELRDATKYDRMLAFGEVLPRIRAHVEQDLSRRGLPREKVLATVVRLLEATRIRVGNEEYARHNDSYGLTTLRNEHVDVVGSTIRFHFRGKSGKDHAIDLRDSRIARIIKKCQEMDGQELFEFLGEDGRFHDVGSTDVNTYLREITGEDFTAKDFRTWSGTVLCALCLVAFEEFENATQAKKNVTTAIKEVAQRLGNTPAVCRKCYVHPAILDSYLEGEMTESLAREVAAATEPTDGAGLSREEKAILSFLRSRLHPEAETAGRQSQKKAA